MWIFPIIFFFYRLSQNSLFCFLEFIWHFSFKYFSIWTIESDQYCSHWSKNESNSGKNFLVGLHRIIYSYTNTQANKKKNREKKNAHIFSPAEQAKPIFHIIYFRYIKTCFSYLCHIFINPESWYHFRKVFWIRNS